MRRDDGDGDGHRHRENGPGNPPDPAPEQKGDQHHQRRQRYLPALDVLGVRSSNLIAAIGSPRPAAARSPIWRGQHAIAAVEGPGDHIGIGRLPRDSLDPIPEMVELADALWPATAGDLLASIEGVAGHQQFAVIG